MTKLYGKQWTVWNKAKDNVGYEIKRKTIFMQRSEWNNWLVGLRKFHDAVSNTLVLNVMAIDGSILDNLIRTSKGFPAI